MKKEVIIAAIVISVGIAAGQIVPWYIDRSDRIAEVQRREAQRMEAEQARLARELEEMIEAEEASKRAAEIRRKEEAERSELQNLAEQTVTNARTAFMSETYPRLRKYIEAHWAAFGEVAQSERSRALKAGRTRIKASIDALKADLHAGRIDYYESSRRETRLKHELAALEQEYVLEGIVDDYLTSPPSLEHPTVRAMRWHLNDMRMSVSFILAGTTENQRRHAIRTLKALFEKHLGAPFDAAEYRAAHDAWGLETVFSRETIRMGKSEVALGPKTPGNVLEPQCRNSDLVAGVKAVVGDRDPCRYRFIDFAAADRD